MLIISNVESTLLEIENRNRDELDPVFVFNHVHAYYQKVQALDQE